MIYNLHAIGLAIILAIGFFILNLVLPVQFVESDMGLILFSFIGTIIAGISEVLGLRARLFWLPVWLIGIFSLLYLTYTAYGWMITLGLIAVVIALLVVLSYKMERSSWADAPKELAEFKRLTDPGKVQFWEKLNVSFFFPDMINYTPEICDHNISVINTLEEKGVIFEGIVELKKDFEAQIRKISDENIEINSDLKSQVISFIDKEIEALMEEED